MVAGEECREVAGGGEDEDVVGIKVLGLRFGLGYEPTHADKRRVALERKERSLAHLQGRGPYM